MLGTQMKIRKFSPMSERAGSVRPGQKLLCSTTANWSSVLLQTFEQPACVEHYESAPSPDSLVVVVLRGVYDIESFSAGSWKKASYSPGIGGLTAPFTTNRLRWHSKASTHPVLVRLYIPQEYFSEAKDEYRRAGERSDAGAPNSLSFADPVISSVLTSLGKAVARGAPDLYADAGARFLATHLLARSERWSEQKLGSRTSSELTDRRLSRVLEFMQQHCVDSVTLDQLASEASMSRFHFSRLFKAKMGVTPHRHIVRLRMQRAKELLSETGLSVGEIGMSCGYVHQSHFAASFEREYHSSPATFRKKHLGGWCNSN